MPSAATLLPDDLDLSITVDNEPGERFVNIHVRVSEDQVVRLRLTAEEVEPFAKALLRAARFITSGASLP